jgi:hypothetical protein
VFRVLTNHTAFSKCRPCSGLCPKIRRRYGMEYGSVKRVSRLPYCARVVCTRELAATAHPVRPSPQWNSVPAPVYYEWRDDPEGKTPFAVARVDGDPVAFAGIWETWKSPEGEYLRTFATITTDANQLVGQIQDRMPVIIEPENWPLWLGEANGNPVTLLRPAAEGVLRFWPVDKKVNNVRNDGPDLIEPDLEMEPTLI